MIYEMRVYRCVPDRLPALLKRFETVTLKLWEKHGIRQAGFFYHADRRVQPGADLFPALGVARRAREEVGRVHDRSGLDEGARRGRSGRPDRRQHRQPDPDADRLLVGEGSVPAAAGEPWRNPDIRTARAEEVDPTLITRPWSRRNEGFALSSSTSAAPVITIGTVQFGNDLPISIIAGPCQLESRTACAGGRLRAEGASRRG